MNSVAVVGDLVASRASSDRRTVHEQVVAALVSVNEQFPAISPLAVTAGDEHQGVYDSLGAALSATLRLRLLLLPAIDVRHGIGIGDLTVLQESPLVQDGPAWWAARAAVEEVERLADDAATAGARTMVADAPVVNAALLGRDSLVSALDERGLSVLRGVLSGRTQRELAIELGISASAVSQRVRRDGLAVVQRMDTWLGEAQ